MGQASLKPADLGTAQQAAAVPSLPSSPAPRRLFSGVLRHSASHFFCVLTSTTLDAYSSEKTYNSGRDRLGRLQLAEVTVASAATASNKGPRKFLVYTWSGVLQFKAKSAEEAHKWVSSINRASADEQVQERRKLMLSDQKRALLCVQVFEARNIHKKYFSSGSGAYRAHARVYLKSKERAASSDSSQCKSGVELRRLWCVDHLQGSTTTSFDAPPVWNDGAFLFPAVCSADVLHFELHCVPSKTISFFETTSVVGTYSLDLQTVQWFDSDGQAGGVQRWLSLSSRRHQSDNSDLSMDSTLLLVRCLVLPSDPQNYFFVHAKTTPLKEEIYNLLQVPRSLEDYSSFKRSLSVFVGTWNIGNAAPTHDLSSWLGEPQTGRGCDILAIGSQESAYGASSVDSSSSADHWLGLLTKHLGPSFFLLKQENLWGIRLCVFVHENVARYIGKPQKRTVATGLGNVMGNKGASAISLDFLHTSLCFVNVHLAAHQHKSARRNTDLGDIFKGLHFSNTVTDVCHQFDHLLLMGDLNYRLDYGNQGMAKAPSHKQFQVMLQHIRCKKFEKLFCKDQLTKERNESGILCGFEEGTYKFPPTFKVLRDCYLDYDPQRSPSWTDRILWKSRSGLRIKQTSLGMSSEILSSDHKPVFATFELGAYLLLPHCDVAFELIDMYVVDIAISSSIVACGSAPVVKLRSPSILRAKATIKPPVYGTQKPIALRYTSFERLCQQPIQLEVTVDGDRLGFGLLSFYELQEIEVDSSIPLRSYAFSLPLSYGAVFTGTLKGGIRLKWLKNRDSSHMQVEVPDSPSVSSGVISRPGP